MGPAFFGANVESVNYSWANFDFPDVSLTQAEARYNSKPYALREVTIPRQIHLA
jgi:hypothetical protein